MAMTTGTPTDADSRADDPLTETVRSHYAAAARAVLTRPSTEPRTTDGCCGPAADESRWGEILYTQAQRAELPEAAVLASLGCGNPIAVADLRPGETVLDLGSGGGIDVLLSAARVGPDGYVYGVDMTEEMLELSRHNAAEAGVANVEFRKGRIESIPLESATVDVVISNCVVNLSSDKGAVLREIVRVLRPGGRLGISDVVADDALTTTERAERGSFTGCIAGALSFGEYRAGLAAMGFEDVDVTPTHPVADGLYGAIVRATKPARWTPEHVRPVELPAPPASLSVLDEVGCGPGCDC
jgi:arsenite methyltransferase